MFAVTIVETNNYGTNNINKSTLSFIFCSTRDPPRSLVGTVQTCVGAWVLFMFV